MADRGLPAARAHKPRPALSILQTSGHICWGGEPNHVFLLSSGLLAAGHRVIVAAPRASALAERCIASGIPVCTHVRFSHQLRDYGLLHDARAVAQLIRDHNVSVLHTHASRDTWAGALASLASDVRIVRTRHNLQYNRTGMLNRWLYGRLDGLIVISKAIRDEFRRNHLVPNQRITVIPDAADLRRFYPRPLAIGLREEWGIPVDGFVIGSAGRLSIEKGHHVLVEAAAMVVCQAPSAWVVIAGEGAEETALRCHIERRGLVGRVILLGFREDIEDFYAATNLLVVPSLSEGLGTVVIEGLAMGKPIIASNIGGIPELIEDGRTGRLVPPNDAAALAATILALMTSPTAAAAFGQAGRARVARHYSLGRLTARTLRLYEQITAAAPVRHASRASS
ncbi:MAG: glycosyltransferase family 4 protein [Gemmatimonadetes bacterium]|nr:glycosyltransferase family 4 protein [Gemmatimonadota bacterium]